MAVDTPLRPSLLPYHHSTVDIITPLVAPQSPSTFTTNEFPSVLMASSATAAVSNVLQEIQEPDVEAEVLVDLSHVIVDFSGFLNLSKDASSCVGAFCREHQVVLSMIGRILVLCADWLPDHHIFPEELAIQIFFLMQGLLQVSRIVSIDPKA